MLRGAGGGEDVDRGRLHEGGGDGTGRDVGPDHRREKGGSVLLGVVFVLATILLHTPLVALVEVTL